jgi:hypothetical protein
MSSCSSVIANIVEPKDEQELIPTAIACRGYLPQRLPTALVTASRMASWRIAHWN